MNEALHHYRMHIKCKHLIAHFEFKIWNKKEIPLGSFYIKLIRGNSIIAFKNAFIFLISSYYVCSVKLFHVFKMLPVIYSIHIHLISKCHYVVDRRKLIIFYSHNYDTKKDPLNAYERLVCELLHAFSLLKNCFVEK